VIPGHVDVAPEVRALVPDLALERAVAEATTQGFACPVCLERGTAAAGNPVSVIVLRHVDGLRVLFAHRGCAPSYVLDAPGPQLGPEHDEADVATSTLTAVTSAGRRALLCMEIAEPPLLVTAAGDSLDPAVGRLLEAGWALMTGVHEEILTLPTLAGRWRVQIDPATGEGHVRAPDGLLLSELPADPDWADLALTDRHVTLLVGPFGLSDAIDQAAAITAAITRGAVAGAILPARPPRPPSGRAQPPKRRRR
jgi:hypothetical protein